MSFSTRLVEGSETAGGGEFVMSTFAHDQETLTGNALSVAVIGPEEQRRQAVARALSGPQVSQLREITAYPGVDDIPQLLKENFDVVIVDLDADPERALDLIENICSDASVTVMVYSYQTDSEMLVRSMRAGAREFLTQPISQSAIAEALVRASVRRPVGRAPRKALGKVLVFVGAKGGSGVTTVAGNFSVALAQESGQSVMLIDLNFPLGDVALDLGILAQYSTANALQNFSRLDANFLSSLLVKHGSGLSVLAGPDRYTPFDVSSEGIEKLLAISRQDFDYVVIDAGSKPDSAMRALFEGASTIYLVTQISIPELRNSNRLISEFLRSNTSRLEIILNRFPGRSMEIDEENITKALTAKARWKIPGDYPTARKAQNTATPLAMDDSPISRVVKQMARVACGLPETVEKKKKFGLF
jgi:pilus assembly protein CpaE